LEIKSMTNDTKAILKTALQALETKY